MNNRFYFDKSIIDRSGHLREESTFAKSDFQPSLSIIPIWNDQALVTDQNIPKGVFIEGAGVSWFLKNSLEVIFLGTHENKNYYCADISNLEDPREADLPAETTFVDLRNLATSINPKDAGYLAYARGMAYWNRTQKFCGLCGSKTKSHKLGHERRCTNNICGHSHFPRTDPAIIVLVTHPTEEKCLLGRNVRFKGLRFSTIAGFVEPGEALEHAVAREVGEETGIGVSEITYKASQPWPFPASIMLGFRAKGTSTDIICLDKELIEARWFTRKEIIHLSSEGDVLPPLNYSISRWLIESWLEEK